MVSLLSLSLCYFFDVGFAKAALQFCVQDFFTCSVTAIKECHSKKYAFCLWHGINFISVLALLHSCGWGLTSTKLILATVIASAQGFQRLVSLFPSLLSCPTEMLKQLRAQAPALDPEFGVLQDDNSSAEAFWKIAASPSCDRADGTEARFTRGALFRGVPIAAVGCRSCGGSVISGRVACSCCFCQVRF